MIQDIEPRVFNNLFLDRKAEPQDLFLAYQGDTVLTSEDKDKLWYPSFADFEAGYPDLLKEGFFLFAIDDINFYLIDRKGLDAVKGWTYVSTERFRTEPNNWRSFAGAIGWQLNRWYQNHLFCSRCGKSMKRSDKQRVLLCEACGLHLHPTISPCVIVAVHDGHRLLLTKYAGRAYARFALIAGFVEIGESLEDAVRREVMEEAGLKVKKIKFYKSQPWPFTDSLLAGFFAELDGDDTITIQEDELALGVWMKREEIPADELKLSLTGEMMDAFRTGDIK